MLKIFLAEDEVVVRETIKRMIPWEELGFELVGEAADGEMALPLLIRQQPDLLITDIKMPFMDGLTLARLAKKEIPGLKVVILSGYDDFNYAKQAIRNSAPSTVKAMPCDERVKISMPSSFSSSFMADLHRIYFLHLASRPPNSFLEPKLQFLCH